MIEALDVVARLLGAASQVADRAVKLAYLGEARVTLDREISRYLEQLLLLGAMEAKVSRTRPVGGHA